MKPKTMILMVVAVGCGLVASYMTSRLLAERTAAPAPVNTVKVLVAKKKIPMATLIKDPAQFFDEKEMMEGSYPSKAIKGFDDIRDKRVNKVINEEAIVRSDDLFTKDMNLVGSDLAPGQRATAIQVSAVSLAGGFVLPGSRVDVIATLQQGDRPAAKTILQNMLVLAIDTKPGRDEGQTAMIGSTVTIAATQEECQRLALAQRQGELKLTLRPPDDKSKDRVRPTTAEDLDRPPRDVVNGGSDEETSPSVQLGQLPKDPPPMPAPEVKPESAPEVKPAPAVEEPPAKTHTLVVQVGEFTQKAVFTWDEATQSWKNGGIGRAPGGDEPPVRRAPPPPPPAPASPDGKPEYKPEQPESRPAAKPSGSSRSRFGQ